MRIILYTGKGGVGKTSIAAATACLLAKEGKKVLIMSTDQAHSLSDSLDTKLGPKPLNITENLDAMEVDAVTECELAWGNLKDFMYKMMTSKSEESLEAEELLVFPGFEELISLFKIKEIYDEGKYDVLIVDCAPMGETLALLKFPEMFGQFIESVVPWKRKATKLVGPTIEKLTKIPMPSDVVFDDIENLVAKIDGLRELMWNKDIVSMRIVTTPEKIVIKETKRNFSYLHLYNYNVDAIIVNKLYPKEALEGYFYKWIKNQKDAIEDIKDSFKGIPIFYLELQKHELRTINLLKEVSKKIYGNTDPYNILFRNTIFSEAVEDNKQVFRILLPFFDINDVELLQKGEELTLIIKNERRKFILPNKLKNKEIQSAKYEDGMLKLIF
ncbi:MAG: ArsA family ATPase [Epulopiscium sp.]|nr:ArsA family ATPase [Candidatus Epulonipiscium sp.]